MQQAESTINLNRSVIDSPALKWAFECLQEIDQDDWLGWTGLRIIHQIPKFPVVPKWERVKSANLPLKDLVNALKHPSKTIVRNSALLLIHGSGGTEAAQLIKEVFQEGNENTLWAISGIAPYIWGNEALEIVL
ncbi:MAG: hypothetical protein RLP12_05945, partial [Ekhidna sp.]